MQTENPRNRTLLVVDDDLAIRETLQELFEQEGYAVFCAANGAEALTLLERIHDPALILLDQNMPVMSGAEFLRHKAAEPRIAGLPVVVMSAEKCLHHGHGPTEFLSKPFNVGQLLATVEQYSRRAARRVPAMS